MKSIIFLFTLALALASVAMGQKSVGSSSQATASSATKAAAPGADIAAGTQVSGQLQSTLDVNKAKVGDQVLVKTTKAIKQNGKTVVDKGSMFVGRVTDVTKKTKENAASRVGVLFDRLRQNGSEISINSVITSVLKVNNSAAALSMSDDMQMSSSTSSRSSTQASGGLLGGVTSTVGGVVDTTTNTVGGVTNTTGRIVGGTTNAATSNIRGLSISQSTDASVQGSSNLSLTGGNLKLDKGTTFNLSVSSATSVDNN